MLLRTLVAAVVVSIGIAIGARLILAGPTAVSPAVNEPALHPWGVVLVPASLGAPPDANLGINHPRTPLPAPQPPETYLYQQTVAVEAGDTLGGLLEQAGVSRNETSAVLEALRPHYDPRRIRPGQEITLDFRVPKGGEGEHLFEGLSVAVDFAGRVRVARSTEGAFSARRVDIELKREPVALVGTITSSLYQDAVRADVPVPVILEMIRAYSWDVDFQRDLQPGDRFEVLYQSVVDADGREVHAGELRFAALTLGTSRLPIYLHTAADGETDYFNAKGESARKALLRTPIDGARLSSGFGMRNHPILGYTKMHRGIDFATPVGTPIYAAGNGTVEVASMNGAYGLYVRLRHSAGYGTAYAHLSRLSRGLAPGQRLRQGQIIGYVGTTGRSTGPHLHYEILRADVQVNPMTVKMPSGRQLEGAELARFLDHRDALDGLYAEAAAGRQVAAIEP